MIGGSSAGSGGGGRTPNCSVSIGAARGGAPTTVTALYWGAGNAARHLRTGRSASKEGEIRSIPSLERIARSTRPILKPALKPLHALGRASVGETLGIHRPCAANLATAKSTKWTSAEYNDVKVSVFAIQPSRPGATKARAPMRRVSLLMLMSAGPIRG